MSSPPTPPLTGNRCRCSACGLTFSSEHAFNRHRTGKFAVIGKPETRRCLSMSEMIERGFMLNAAGAWTTGARPSFDRLD